MNSYMCVIENSADFSRFLRTRCLYLALLMLRWRCRFRACFFIETRVRVGQKLLFEVLLIYESICVYIYIRICFWSMFFEVYAQTFLPFLFPCLRACWGARFSACRVCRGACCFDVGSLRGGLLKCARLV